MSNEKGVVLSAADKKDQSPILAGADDKPGVASYPGTLRAHGSLSPRRPGRLHTRRPSPPRLPADTALVFLYPLALYRKDSAVKLGLQED